MVRRMREGVVHGFGLGPRGVGGGSSSREVVGFGAEEWAGRRGEDSAIVLG